MGWLWTVGALMGVTMVLTPSAAGADEGVETMLEVRPSNLRNSTGLVRCLLFAGPKGFPGKPQAALRQAESRIVGRSAVCVFDDLPAGTYALSMIHDEDESGELNTNIFGVPTEGYAFSNDAYGTFGPPDYDEAAFVYRGGPMRLSLKLRY